MTLNARIGVLWIFWRFQAAWHISRANCVETNWDRHRRAAYEIFSIERRLQRFKSRFFYVKENLRMRASKSGTPVKVVILPLLASLSLKRLQVGMGMLPMTTSTSDELFNRINVDDFERPWASKNMGFLLFFAIFGCSAHSKNELRRNGWRYRWTVCEQELL